MYDFIITTKITIYYYYLVLYLALLKFARCITLTPQQNENFMWYNLAGSLHYFIYITLCCSIIIIVLLTMYSLQSLITIV